MNKKEKAAICELLSEWELQTGGSASEAAARYSCAESVRKTLNITAEDMAFDRMWQISKSVGDTSEEFTDALIDAIHADYESVIDAFEAGPSALLSLVAKEPTL